MLKIHAADEENADYGRIRCKNAYQILQKFRQKTENCIYELQLLGLDKNDSCIYTNSGTATISDTELQELLHTKGLPFPNGIVGQRIKILSNLEMQKEQAQADILQKLSSSGEELNIDG